VQNDDKFRTVKPARVTGVDAQHANVQSFEKYKKKSSKKSRKEKKQSQPTKQLSQDSRNQGNIVHYIHTNTLICSLYYIDDQSLQLASNPASLNDNPYCFVLGSLVQLGTPPCYGKIKWIGQFPGDTVVLAGVEVVRL